MTKSKGDFGWGPIEGSADGRLRSPSFDRNHQPIIAALEEFLPRKEASADPLSVIEIGSGSGQHITAFGAAFDHLTWWPTELDPAHRHSIDAWCNHHQGPNVMPAMELDALAADWVLGRPGRPPRDRIAAIIAINVIHIAPWNVAQALIRAAGDYLRQDGQLIFYGPFAKDGVHNAPSNAAFDSQLRARDPQWGVRDLNDIAAEAVLHDLTLAHVMTMPSNNHLVVLARK